MTPADLLGDDSPASEPLLVGVSGGLDSMVLAHALHTSGHRIVVAHVHHGLRGAPADEDLKFVAEYADGLGVPFEQARLSFEVSPGASVQALARDERYKALAEIARRRGITTVAVGHHADDQAETVLLNLARGAGPAGLGGMSKRSPMSNHPDLILIRPLIGRAREDLRSYAEAHALSWRDDPTNADLSYRRNALRAGVMPALRHLFGDGVIKSIARSAGMLRAFEDTDVSTVTAVLLRALGSPLDGRHVRAEGGFLSGEPIGGLPGVWLQRLLLDALKAWIPGSPRTEHTAGALRRLLESQPGRQLDFQGGTVWREREGLAFVAGVDRPAAVSLRVGSTVRYGRFTIQAGSPPVPGSTEHAVDLPPLGPMVVRPWKTGDRIRIHGGSKKVKDVLTEGGVPCFTRESAPVLAVQDQVLWVIGLRAFHEGVGIGRPGERVRVSFQSD